MDKTIATETPAMLTVTHAMSFVTSCGGNCVKKSQWFKHPNSVDDYWWQVTSDVENQAATISIMVEKDRNIFTDSNPEPLSPPFIICANECKVYRKILGPGQPTMATFLLPESTSFTVHRVTSTRMRYRLIKVKFGGVRSQLTVVVSFTVLNDKNMQHKMILYSFRPPMNFLSFAQDIHETSHVDESLLEALEQSDLILEMKDGRTIGARKAVLTACSPVFRAMFMHDTVEKRDNRIVMPDVSLEAITEALRFMHTGAANLDDVDMVQEVVELAERYDLVLLKIMCESALMDSLYRDDGWVTPEYAAELLSMATMYRMITLKEACEVALAWHIRDHTLEYFKLALDTKAEFLKKFAFERLVAMKQPHFQDPFWKELQRDYPEEVEALLVAQINSHGSSPGIIRCERD
ncbi:Speckle-type POZ protein [Frankliniella fusca]|uniref:Speckle-type POZ protein n=1 Tax=Frankliniella fusca TaxID=407009 RepID=A0AAE1L786_9NEOP|nr:Speckle-type POZ protein [Frankliniella fusca]